MRPPPSPLYSASPENVAANSTPPVEAVFSPPSCTSDKHYYGATAGNVLLYSDVNAFSWWGGVLSLVPEYVGLTAYSRDGDVLDRIVPDSAISHLIDATWSLRSAPCAYVGNPTTGKITTTRKLELKARELIALEINSQRVYYGRLLSDPKTSVVNVNGVATRTYVYDLQGLKAYAGDIRVYGKTYAGIDVAEAVKDLAQLLASKTPVKYDASRISTAGYVLSNQEFDNTTVLNAIDTLTELAGGFEWGVDVYGYLFFSQIATSAVYHYWLDRHDVAITNLEQNTRNIKNAVYIETPTGETGEKARVLLEDAASIAEWGRIEENISLPSNISTGQSASISDLDTHPTGGHVVNEGNALDNDAGTYGTVDMSDNAIAEIVLVELTNPLSVTQITLKLGHPTLDYGYPDGVRLQIFDANTETTSNYKGAAGHVKDATFNVNFTSSAITLAIRPISGLVNNTGNASYDDILVIRDIIAVSTNITDAQRYANQYLAAYSQPFAEGSMLLKPNLFVAPMPCRITDHSGVSKTYLTPEISYSLKRGLTASAAIGSSQVNVQRLLTAQKRAQDNKVQEVEKSQNKLAEGTGFKDHAINLKDAGKIIRASDGKAFTLAVNDAGDVIAEEI